MRSRGVLVSLGRGVDRLRDHPFDHWSQCQAALDLAGPGSVLGLRSAARLHGFYAYRRADEIEVIVRHGHDARSGIGRVVQTRVLPPHHVTKLRGFAVTTVARTFFDLCGDPDPRLRRRGGHPFHETKMARVYNDAAGRRGLSFVQEVAVLAVLARRGRRGTRLVRRLLLRFGPTYVPTRSDTETLFLELVASFGLPEPEKQAVVTDVEGWIGTVDFLWRAERVIVEVDSGWHDGPLDKARDEERDRRAEDAGYAVRRYRYRDVVGEPNRVHRELVVAMRRMTV
ncbi:MAG TPA: DUF559 domain-containing protein [Acidimicrobiales bacterium]|nr:DUF559 domain-containing protein [Acidimicrobiales bacterium]